MISMMLDFVRDIVGPALRELFRIGGPRKEIQEFTSTRGFDYAKELDPTQLDLYATSFFGRFDVARDVITGVVDKTRFVCFSHDRTSGRGENAVIRSVVAFEVAPKGDYSPTLASSGWKFEKSSTYFFLWRWNDKQPKSGEEIEGFVNSALKVLASLQSHASSAGS
jgi:hypothetical protein